MSPIIKHHYDVTVPLDGIPEKQKRDMVFKKASHIKQALNITLDNAIAILDDLEASEAWIHAEMQKDVFFRIVCGVEDLDLIRKGYAIMRTRKSRKPL